MAKRNVVISYRYTVSNKDQYSGRSKGGARELLISVRTKSFETLKLYQTGPQPLLVQTLTCTLQSSNHLFSWEQEHNGSSGKGGSFEGSLLRNNFNILQFINLHAFPSIQSK